MVWTNFGKVFLSKSSGSEEEEVGEERCVATNDASGQPMASGERHRMASRVQILMHYARFVFYGTGWIGVCKVYWIVFVNLATIMQCAMSVFVKFGRLMVRELLPLLVMCAASTFKLWSDVVDTRCFVKTFTSTNTSTRNTLSSRSENLTSFIADFTFQQPGFPVRLPREEFFEISPKANFWTEETYPLVDQNVLGGIYHHHSWTVTNMDIGMLKSLLFTSPRHVLCPYRSDAAVTN